MTSAREPVPATQLPSGSLRRHVLVSAALTALGGVLFGYDTGVISSGTLCSPARDFPGLTASGKDLLTSFRLASSAAADPASPPATVRSGRWLQSPQYR